MPVTSLLIILSLEASRDTKQNRLMQTLGYAVGRSKTNFVDSTTAIYSDTQAIVDSPQTHLS
jgi:hypothetical protein